MLLYKFDLVDSFSLDESDVYKRAFDSLVNDQVTIRYFKPGWELNLVRRGVEGTVGDERIIYQFEVHGEFEEDSCSLVVEETN